MRATERDATSDSDCASFGVVADVFIEKSAAAAAEEVDGTIEDAQD